MSFYDDASLVVIPSGFKTSKVYAEKPTDGSGDLTFTRTGDTATRVNSAGLIEKVRTNLLQQSQNLAAAAWSLGGTATRTANYGTAPDGTQTSTRIQWTAAASFELYQYTGVSAPIYGSVYIKGTAGQTIKYTGNSVTLNGSWQRIEGAIAIDGANTYFTISGTAGTNTAFDFELWGAQAETGDIATPYIPTTTAAVSVGPTANTARLDYLGSTCPRLLLEPQRTNAFTFSESFDNAAWTKSAAATTITANSTISPSGYQDADTWTINAAGARYVGQTKTVTAGAVTASFFVKKGTSDWFYIRIEDGANFAGYTFNVATGQLGQSVSSVLTPTASIIDYGNGWYRCIITTTVAGTSVLASGWVATSASTISGLLGASLICWGAQLEAGAYATSYIPTLAASATRGADACSKTGISSLIGQTEGVLFLDFVYTKVGKTNQSIVLGGASNYSNTIYLLTTEASGDARFQLRIGGTALKANIPTTFVDGTRYKIAMAYKSGDSAFYVNGVSVGTSATSYGAVSEAISQFVYNWPYGGDEQWCSPISQTLFFTTRLTNAQLAELTTL